MTGGQIFWAGVSGGPGRHEQEARGRPGGEEYPPSDSASGCVSYTQEPALRIHRKGQPSEGHQVQQNFPLGVAEDPDYKREATIDQFLMICEKLIYTWQQERQKGTEPGGFVQGQ